MIGTTLAHFKITAKLGEGGMGEVYRAEDSKLGREVAIKVLPDAFTADPERLARFEREARLLAALNHPNVASVYSFEKAEPGGDEELSSLPPAPIHFLVMELAEGDTLAERIERGAIPTDEVLAIARQIAEALEAAHEKGIIHRDLKPGNVKVDEQNGVKVLDFGLAKALDPPVTSVGEGLAPTPSMSPTLTAAMTGANVLLGTAAYMSPEQAKGKAVDKRTDIWAFGVLVWEMLTGQRLFRGDSITDTLADVLRADIDLAAVSKSVPPPLVEVLHRCLERDPDKRLHDVADARLVIEELEEGDWVLPTAEQASAKGLPLGLAIGGLVGLIIGAMAMWMLARPAPPTAARSSRFEIPIPDAVQAAPAISSDGTKIVYASEGRLWVRDLDRLEARAVTGGEGGYSPFWSPDARSIGFGAESALWRVPAEGGTKTLLSNDSMGSSGTAVWRSDDRIFFSTGNSGIHEVSAVGGESREAVQLSEDQVDFHELDVLPGGKGFLTIVHKRENQDFGNVTLVSGDKQTELVQVHGAFLGDPVYSETGHVLFGQSRNLGINGIWAVPFSLDELEVTGEPFVVARDAGNPDAVGGTLVYTPDPTVYSNELVWVDRTGRVLETVGESRKGFWPGVVLSPDGSRASVSIRERQNWNIWVVDLGSGQTTRVSFEEKAFTHISAWTPSGDQLAYGAARTGDDQRVMIKRPDASTQTELLTQGGSLSLAFSPDGRYLIFGRPRPGYLQDLWLRDLEQGTEDAFVQTDSWDTGPSFSPDGRFVAYCTGAGILVTRFPDADSQWQIAERAGYPKWSSDGTRLYFFKGDDFMEVEIDPGPPFRSSPPVRLFTFRRAPANFGFTRSFGVDGNGERFLMVRVSGIPPGIVVYQNWLADLD